NDYTWTQFIAPTGTDEVNGESTENVQSEENGYRDMQATEQEPVSDQMVAPARINEDNVETEAEQELESEAQSPLVESAEEPQSIPPSQEESPDTVTVSPKRGRSRRKTTR